MAFADECPYMVMCDNSVADLNSRFPSDTHVKMEAFRPVIQISEAKAYDEDFWAELKINEITFDCYKPCTR